MLQKAHFAILISPILGYHGTRTRKVCPVEIKSENSSDSVQHEVICHNSWCCQDGCCPWYINVSGAVAVLVFFIIVLKLMESCWHKYCRDLSTLNQENMVMMNLSASASRLELVNYGSYASEETILSHKDDEPPTYEEIVRK